MAIVVAGIDVSKKSLNIHLNGKDETATNDTDGFRKIAGILKDGGAERVVMEATGRMHRALLQSLHDRGFAACAVNPSTPASPGTSRRPVASWRRPTGSTPGSLPPSGPRSRPCRPPRLPT